MAGWSNQKHEGFGGDKAAETDMMAIQNTMRNID